MKMYALTPKQSSEKFPAMLLALISALKLTEFDILHKEIYSAAFPHDRLILPEDANLLLNALTYLVKDHGFFTISSKSKALIIPFEGNHFNIILPDDQVMPNIEDLCAEDASTVLEKYSDAYEGFGIDATFLN
jgi:hypothetical protein